MLSRARRLFKGDGLGATLMRAFAGSAGLRIAGMGFGFLVGIQLARGLGASDYGVYGLSMSIISLISIPAEFGLPQLVTREVAAANVYGRWGTIWAALRWARGTVFKLSFSMVAIGLSAWLILKEHIEMELAYTLLTGAFLILLVPLGNIHSATLRGLQQIVKGQLADVVLRPALFSCLLVMAWISSPSGLTPSFAMGMQCAAAAMALFASYLMVRNSLPHDSGSKAKKSQRRNWLRSAFPMALTESMRMLQGNIATLALGWLATNAVVGVFRVGSSMGMLMMMPITLVHIVSSPVFARLHAAKDTAKLQRLVSLTTLAMTAGVALVTLPFLVAGDAILGEVFGEDFHGANTVLLVLSAGTIVGSAFGPGASLLNMTGHERRVTKSLALNLILIGLLIYPLTVIWGAAGAALTTSIAYIGWNMLMWIGAKHALGIDTSLLSCRTALRHAFRD